MLLIIIIATLIISLISLIGIFSLAIKEKSLNKLLLFLVALSAGVLLGTAFFHLIPEISTKANAFVYVVLGFILFFIIEKYLYWQHCHEGKCHIHTFAYMNLFGDFIHNFLDGLIIASSFLINFQLGITTTIAIAIHEIPQEIGDFGVLLYGGFSKKKAILLNLLTALTAVLGGIIGYFLSSSSLSSLSIIPAVAAGGFIYIACSDLIPEMKKDTTRISILHFIIFLLGIMLTYLLGVVE